MRIAIITPWFPTKKNPLYGIFVKNQAHALSKHCEVIVVLYKRTLIPYRKQYENKNLTIVEAGFPFPPITSEYWLKKWAIQYAKLVLKVHEDHPIDVLHCHDHYGAYVGHVSQNFERIPYFVTVHNSNILNDKLVDWKKSYLEKVFHPAVKVFCVSSEMKEKLATSYATTNTEIVPNFIDPDLFVLGTKNDEVFRFVFIGDFNENKGVLLIIEAFAKLNIDKKLELHLIGDGELKDEVNKAIEQHNLKDKVKLYGWIPNELIPEVFQQSDVLISFSSTESFGMTVIEAMSCGLMIVYHETGGLKDTVNPTQAVKVSERTEDALSTAMLESIELRKSISKETIRQHVIDYYSEDAVIPQIIKYYKDGVTKED